MSKNIHIKKFADGKLTPSEYHSLHAFGDNEVCSGCGARPSIAIHVFAEEAEMLRRDENLKLLQIAEPDKYASMLVRFKPGRFLRISRTVVCLRCKSEAYKAAAKAPSWCYVEFNEPPPDIKPQVGYTG